MTTYPIKPYSWDRDKWSTWQPLEPGIRALFHFMGQLMCDEPEVDLYVSELRAIYATHPYVSESKRLHVNTSNDWHRQCWVFSFGAYGCTHIVAFGSLDDALEDAAETLLKVSPGSFVDVEWDVAFRELKAEGKFEGCESILDISETEIHELDERATQDLTYTEPGYLASWEWTVRELDRKEIVGCALQLLD